MANTKKKVLSLVMALVLALSLLPVNVFANGENEQTDSSAPAQTEETVASGSQAGSQSADPAASGSQTGSQSAAPAASGEQAGSQSAAPAASGSQAGSQSAAPAASGSQAGSQSQNVSSSAAASAPAAGESAMNKEPIEGSESYNGVKVEVSAPAGAFLDGTVLSIEPVKDSGVRKAVDAVLGVFGVDPSELPLEKISDAVNTAMSDQGASPDDSVVPAAFDIKFIYKGEEIQPADGFNVQVTFSADGEDSVLADAENLQVFHITDGQMGLNTAEVKAADTVKAEPVDASADAQPGTGTVSVEANSFSIYVVSGTNSTTEISGDSVVAVGKSITLYSNATRRTNSYYHEWSVEDGTGSATIEQYSSDGRYATLTGVSTGTVTVTHGYQSNDWKNEDKTITVVAANPVTITDNIASTGKLTASLTAAGATGVTYTWQRSLNDSTYSTITPAKVSGDNYNVVGANLDAALDYTAARNAGVVSDNNQRFYYKVTAHYTDASGTACTATSDAFQVPYYMALQNGSFETPKAESGSSFDDSSIASTGDSGNQRFIYDANTNPSVAWKTTASDHEIELLSASTEYTNNGSTYSYLSGKWHNVNAAADGVQFVELNANMAGALYQDVMTVPGTTLHWTVSHRGRDSSTINDKMYVVIMDSTTAAAHASSQSDLMSVARNISNYSGAYADEFGATNTAWVAHSGDYTVPAGQYVTRFFFAASSTAYDQTHLSGSDKYTVGNHIDKVWFSTDMPAPSPDLGNLSITKTISGLESGDNASAGAFTFVVKNSAGDEVGRVALPTATGALTGGLSNLTPGSYTVEETTHAVSGYTYNSTTANGSSGTSATITVAANATAPAAFTNSYTKIPTTTTFSFDKVWDGTVGTAITATVTDGTNDYTFTVNGDSGVFGTGDAYSWTKTVDTADSNIWHVTVSGLPVLASGSYSVSESPMSGYTATVIPAGGTAAVISSVERITPCSVLNITSITSPFMAVKTQNKFILWTAADTGDGGAKLAAAIASYDSAGPFGNIAGEYTYVYGAQTLSNISNKIDGTTISYAGGNTTVTFPASSAWSQLICGRCDMPKTVDTIINSKGGTSSTGSLTVTKSFSGVTALPDKFQILVKDSSNNTVATLTTTSAGRTGTGTLNDPYTWTVSGLTVGSAYTVSETYADVTDYTLQINGTSSTDDTVSIASFADGETAAFTNTYTRNTTAVDFTKTWVNAPAGNNSIAVTVYDGVTTDNATITTAARGTTDGGRAWTKTVGDDGVWTVAVSGLPVTTGHPYAVTETSVNGLSFTGTTAAVGTAGYWTKSVSGSTITNTYYTYAEDSVFGRVNLNLTKYVTGTTTALSGAQFQLFTDSGCTNAYPDIVYTTNDNGTVTIPLTSASDGNTVYYLKEISAPVGYDAAAPIALTVTQTKGSDTVATSGYVTTTTHHYTASVSGTGVDGNALTVYDSKISGQLTVTKAANIDTDSEQFSFGIYNAAGALVDTLTMTKGNSGVAHLDYGTYTIVETAPASTVGDYDFGGVTYTGDGTYDETAKAYKVTIDGTHRTLAVTATNTYTPHESGLNISKIVTGGAPSGASFNFTVTIGESLYNGAYTIDGTTYNTTNGVITLADGQTANIKASAGTSYSVVETANNAYSTTITKDGKDASAAQGNILRGGSAVTFTNHYITGSFTIEKVSSASTETKLSGAQFTLYTNADRTVRYDADGNGTVEDGEGVYTTASDGTVSVTGLPVGTYYLAETAAPAGYDVSATVWTITVREGNSTTVTAETSTSGETTTTIGRLFRSIIDFVTGSSSKDYSIATDATAASAATKLVLTVEDTPINYQLTIGKTISGPTTGGSAVFDIYSVNNGVENKVAEYTLNPTGTDAATYTFTAANASWLTAGTYKVVENSQSVNDSTFDYASRSFTANGSATATDYASVTIDDSANGRTATVGCTNNYDKLTAGLTVTKTVSGTGAPSDASFAFSVQLGTGDTVYADATAYAGDGVYTHSMGNGGSWTIANVPYGTSYAVSETADSAYTTTIDGTASGTFSGAATVAYTNSYITQNFTVSKVSSASDSTYLNGAVFQLYRSYDSGTLSDAYGSAQTTATVGTTAGQATFSSLPAGTYYLAETTAPDNYTKNDTVYKVVVNAGGVAITNADGGSRVDFAGGTLTVADKPINFTLTIDKAMSVAGANGTFTFNVYAVDASGNPTGDPLNGKTTPISVSVTNGKSTPVKLDTAHYSWLVGGSYYIDEYSYSTAPAGYTWDRVSFQSGASSAALTAGRVVTLSNTATTAYVLATNTYTRDTAGLTITKALGGEYTAAGAGTHLYSFTVTAPSNTFSGTYTTNSDTNVTFTNGVSDPITITGAGSVTISGLPTDTYTVTESGNAAAISGYTLAVDTAVSGGKLITANASGDYDQSIALTKAGATATFVNNYGYGAGQTEAQFYIHKTGVNNANLEGAVFGIYNDKDCATAAVARVTTDASGMATVTLSNVTGKAVYYVKETTAPAGYQLNDTVWKLTVSAPNGTTAPDVTVEQVSGGLFYKLTHFLTNILKSDDTAESGWTGDAYSADGTRTYGQLTVADTAITADKYATDSIVLQKVDNNNRAITSGAATFTFTNVNNANDTFTATTDTGNEGKATVIFGNGNHADGIYAVTETAAPAGYQAADEIVCYVKATTNSSTDWTYFADGTTRDKYVTTYTTTAGVYTYAACTTGQASIAQIVNAPKTSLSVSKIWQDVNGNTMEAAPAASVTFELYQRAVGASGDYTATNNTVTLDGTVDKNGESTAWVATWTDLNPHYTYTAVETYSSVSGTYTALNSGAAAMTDATNGTITNKRDGGTLNITKVVTGLTGPAASASHTYTFTVTNTADSTQVYTYQAAVTGNGSASTTGNTAEATIALPTGTYTVTEGTASIAEHTGPTTTYDASSTVTVENKAQAAVTVTNNYGYSPEQHTQTVTIIKNWADDSNRDGIRPVSATVELRDANNVLIGTAVIAAPAGTTNTSTGTVSYDSYVNSYAQPIKAVETEYTLSDGTKVVPGSTGAAYTVSYASGNDANAKTDGTVVGDAVTVTNTHTPETIEIPVVKTWAGNYGAIPSGITLALYADGVDTGKTLSMTSNTRTSGSVYVSDNQTTWVGVFGTGTDKLNRYNGGKAIVYSVVETAIGGNTFTGTTYGYWTITAGTGTAASLPDTLKTQYAAAPVILTVTNTYSYSGGGDGGDTPIVIPDPNVPGTDKPTTPTTPTTPVVIPEPATPTTDLPDQEVPKTAKPGKTGDSLFLRLAAAGVSGSALLWLALSGKKRRDEEQ